MRTIICLILLLISSFSLGSNWKPPADPDPRAILNESELDTKEGRYEEALAKQIWYHDNALAIRPSLSGVRLSFALNSWLELGEVYPPALEVMKKRRDKLEDRIRDEKRVRVRFEDFQAFNAFNRTLRSEERTVEVFKWLDKIDPEDAKRLYSVSSESLLKEKEYALIGKYLDARKETRKILRHYFLTSEHKGRHKDLLIDHAGDSLIKKSGNLIALLVINNRKDEANEIANNLKEQASRVVEDKDVLKRLGEQLELALRGELPS